jgi:hypothetical protein
MSTLSESEIQSIISNKSFVSELLKAGFTVSDLKYDFTESDLINARFTEEELGKFTINLKEY